MQAQLVDVEGAGFRFRHALTRDAVVAAAHPAEQVHLARRALDALDDGPTPGSAASSGLSPPSWPRSPATEIGRPTCGCAAPDARSTTDPSLPPRASPGTPATPVRATMAGAVDEVLLRVCALAGQTERAGALGLRLLAARTDPTERADVHLVLGAAELAAGRWDDAEEHAAAARTLTASDPARLARGDALAAQAAIGRNDLDTAVALATAALEGARKTGQLAVECEALEVIGRAERGRDVAKAEAAFTEAHDIAAAAGLRLWQVRALQELGTIDLFVVAEPRPAPRGPTRGRVARRPRDRGGRSTCSSARSTTSAATSPSRSPRRRAARRRRAAGGCRRCR